MKKSLQEAKERAIQMSKEHPEILYRVMDKRNKKAVVTGSEWVYRERILEGWNDVAKYRGGVAV